MTTYEVVKATPEHAVDMAPRLRLADRAEIWASSKATPTRTLLASIKESRWAFAGLVDGEPVCLFGIVPVGLIGPVAVPWLLATDAMERHARMFLHRSRHTVAIMSQAYPLLVNYVDARNKVSIKWLKWLGFDIMEPVPHGSFGLPFHRFEMRTVNV